MKILFLSLLAFGIFPLTNGFQFNQLLKHAEMKEVSIIQFEDDGLAHFSYAIQVGNEMILVDPGRNPQQYYDHASSKGAKIVGVIETHPHADFVSSHLEIHQTTGATIYISMLAGVDYPHKTFDEGDVIKLSNNIRLKAINTPGHSPDGISIIVEENGKDVAVFTGDTLFIGDVGRPDLRESDGDLMATRIELAKKMYDSTREKLMVLDDEVIVYPAHGAGSLCGKAISDKTSSTIGAEKLTNYALQEMTKEAFVELLLEDQPFIPKYFPYNVELNINGAPAYQTSKDKVSRLEKNEKIDSGIVVVDSRNQEQFKKSHIQGAVNIMNGAKFETWLGSIVPPRSNYYLVAESEESLDKLISKTAKIGYEPFIKGAFVYDEKGGEKMEIFDQQAFDSNREAFTVIDIRTTGEVSKEKVFKNAINIPLSELMERTDEIPTDKPVVVHCGTGYRSAIGSSIIQNELKNVKVLDMGSDVKDYIK
ncbi:rhodanese-like domain-containing protein [Aquiflexum sp.]|uniref:MBL fold metallo-hydrolase n=1 Tax=Aquiflexum sp. TaxID=1872584 RepID=UPI003593E0FA